MAKRKKSVKRTGRHGRVGGMISKRYADPLTMGVGVGIGMLAARFVPSIVSKFAPGVRPLFVNLAQAGIGIMVAAASKKSPLLRGAGAGFTGMGLIDAATNAGIMPDSKGETSPAVGANEVMIDLNGGMGGYGYPKNLVAGNVGANFQNKSYVDNVIAGVGNHMAGYGLYV